MKKGKIRRIISIVTIFFMFVLPLCTVADGNTVYINSEKDFNAFVKNCSLDSWSVGKEVILTKDLKLKKFSPIPVFGGTFDGRGNTLSGIKFEKNGSKTGLFRTLTEGATVKNLKAEVNLAPGGTGSKVGGIAGINNGKILNCTFKGKVMAVSYVGGIAGQNSGIISECESDGNIYGKHYVGGIAGQNTGTVTSCTNKSKVNTRVEKTTFDIENIDLENIISTENTVEITDIGGIVGYSSGIIQSCKNSGTVGYNHVGYNVGGIAGRQNGYLSDCENLGKIFGRKDVGGIAGQIEPFTILHYSESSVLSLSDDLNTLEKMIDGLIGQSDVMRSGVSARLSGIKSQTGSAIDLTNELIDLVNGNLDRNVDSISDTSARLTALLNGVTDTIGKYGFIDDDTVKIINNVSADMEKAAADYNSAVDSFSSEINTSGLKKSAEKLSQATRDLNGAATMLRSSMRDFKSFIDDVNSAQKALENVKKSLSDIGAGVAEISSALGELSEGYAKISEGIRNGSIPYNEGLAALAEALTKCYAEMQNITGSMGADFAKILQAFTELNEALKAIDAGDITSGLDKLSTAAGYAADATRDLREAVNRLETSLSTLNVSVKDLKLDDAGTKIKKNTADITNIISSLGNMFDELNGEVEEFAKSPVISIEKFDGNIYETKDALSANISDITDSLEALNNYASGTLGGIGGTLTAVNTQLFKVLDSMTSVIDSALDNTEKSLDDFTMDISEEDTQAQTTGKVADCVNKGTVDGDINAGGIAGSLAIEYDFDPEDDVVREGKRSLDFIYQTRAVIRKCRNEGNIKSKKNCVGGIAGQMKLGCIINCASSGYIESKTGDYVGGIVGDCKTTVKNCTARVSLSGDDYVGGIAGNANHIYDCGAVVTIDEGDEYIGGIAGDTEGLCLANIFIGDVSGGIDSVSYTGIAEEGTVDMVKASENGDIFEKFTAKFIIDDKVVKELSYNYGETLKNIPSIPEKEGYYARWDINDFENLTRDLTVTAVYEPFVTSVEGDKQRKSGLPVVICEGEYSEKTTAEVKKAKIKKFEGKREESWTVKLSDAEKDGMKIHYLPAENMRFTQAVYVLRDGKYVRADCKKDGKYLVFEGTPGETTFGVAPAPVKPGKMTVIILILLLLSSVLRVTVRVKNRKENAKV